MSHDDLPPADVAPLPSTEGGFERVVRRARARRARRLTSVAGALAVVALAGAALASPDAERDEITVADLADEATTTTAPTTSTTSTSHTPTTSIAGTTTSTTSLPRSMTTTTLAEVCCPDAGPPEPVPMQRARLVDASGAPVVGMPLSRAIGGPRVTTTDADGVFTVECDRYPALVAWAVDVHGAPPVTSDLDRWAPLHIGQGGSVPMPPCAVEGEPITDLTLVPGFTITGILTDADGAPMANLVMTAWAMMAEVPGYDTCYCLRATDASGRYWLYGLPPGEIRMNHFGFGYLTVSGASGETVAVDWRPDPSRLPEEYQQNDVVRRMPLPTVPGTPP